VGAALHAKRATTAVLVALLSSVVTTDANISASIVIGRLVPLLSAYATEMDRSLVPAR
jgi:hypothetical protein